HRDDTYLSAPRRRLAGRRIPAGHRGHRRSGAGRCAQAPQGAAMTVAQPAPARLADTIDAYLAQISVSLRPQSVQSVTGILGRFADFLAETHPEVTGAADIGRVHIESYKTWLANRPGRRGGTAANATIRAGLSTVRMFFERIIEWDWDDAPARSP